MDAKHLPPLAASPPVKRGRYHQNCQESFSSSLSFCNFTDACLTHMKNDMEHLCITLYYCIRTKLLKVSTIELYISLYAYFFI